MGNTSGNRYDKIVPAGILILILLATLPKTDAQVSISPYLASSGGSFVANGALSLSFSIGEAVIETLTSDSLIFTQGFQQPFNDSFKNNETTGNILVFYTGVSPDNDGKNDTWIIDNITAYPKNTVTIFDRWGNTVWSRDGYNNNTVVWDGTDKNKKTLPEGTYFYVVTAEKKGLLAKGWVEITKK